MNSAELLVGGLLGVCRSDQCCGCGRERRNPYFHGFLKFELWSRQDPSGPLRPANVVKAGDRLNKDLAAEGSGKRVEVAVHESPAPGFDDDALQLLKVFGIGQDPAMFIAAHEWICAVQQEGFALKLDDYIAKYPEYFGTIFPVALAVGKMFRRHLWHPGGCRSTHVLLQQAAIARGRLRRCLYRGDAGANLVGRTDDGRRHRHRQAGNQQDQGAIRHPAPAQQGAGLHHGVPVLRQ
jgi:hypothetical protein